MAYDPQMATVLALAVDQAYKKYNDPNHKIQLGNYTIQPNEIWVYDEGVATFFGFAASGSYGAGYPANNIVALRGTQSDEEGWYDVEDWALRPCFLGGIQYGKAATGLYDFYNDAYGLETSLGVSIQKAVKGLAATAGSNALYITAHSLGGAMATLAALETATMRSYPTPPILYTFASLHVGDKQFAVSCAKSGMQAYRIANLADWVPSFTGLTADTPGYVHVGTLCSFLWQTDGDWENHSLEDIYLNVVKYHPEVVKIGARTYPQ